MSKSKVGARAKIRDFLEANVGKIATTQQISEVTGIRDYQRRIRELRNEEGMQIHSYKDNIDLKPSEYVLVSLKRLPAIERRISNRLRMQILERNGFTCRTGSRSSIHKNRRRFGSAPVKHEKLQNGCAMYAGEHRDLS